MRLLLGALALLLALVSAAHGQVTARHDTLTSGAGIVAPSPSSMHGTLRAWANDHRLQVLDRYNAFGDRFYDRGAFRRITPRMDREYAIDLISYGFTPVQDYQWARLRSGMRMRMGSIVRAKWDIRTEFKHNARLADRHSLQIDAVTRQAPPAQRSFVEVSYDWEVVSRHHIGVRHTFTQYKPGFDASVFYQYGNDWQGKARAELTVQNAYNNVIFNVLGTHPKDEPYTRSYRQQPVLAQVALASPARFPLRAELYAGWQPRSAAVMQAQKDSTMRYRDRMTLHYLGALAEYDLGPMTVGLMYQRDASALDRRGLRRGVTSDYRTEQRFGRSGGYLIGSWGPLRGEAWFFLEDYYDRQRGQDVQLSTLDGSVDWTEYRKHYRVRISHVPRPTGVYAALEYLALSRRLNGAAASQVASQWTRHWYTLGPSNYRTTAMLGYRFGRGAFTLGINYDLDGDRTFKSPSAKRFDNGFFRFSLAW